MLTFGSSGIRGVFDREITAETALKLGIELAAYLTKNAKGTTVVIGHDQRETSPLLASILESALLSQGCKILRAGLTPTPSVAAATKELRGSAGVTITASHNPPEYNGFKILNRDGGALSRLQEKQLISELESDHEKIPPPHIGYTEKINANALHSQLILRHSSKVQKRKIIVDNAWGTAFLVTASVLEHYGMNMTLLNAPASPRLYRSFEPNHMSRSASLAEWQEIANVSELTNITKSTRAELGVVHDGDGDRALFVDGGGKILSGNDVLAIYTHYFLSTTRKRKVVTTVAASSVIDTVAHKLGGQVVRTRVGDPAVSEKIRELGSSVCFGGEPSGAYIFPEVSLCPDGPMAVAQLLAVLDWAGCKLSTLLRKYPSPTTLEVSVPCRDDAKRSLIEKVIENARALDDRADLLFMDGVRIQFEDLSWVLVRTSGTEPIVRITVEAFKTRRAKRLMKYAMRLVNESR